jgi:hypothetical protein
MNPIWRFVLAVLLFSWSFVGVHEAGHYLMAASLGLSPIISGPDFTGSFLSWSAGSVLHYSGGVLADRKVALAGLWADCVYALVCLLLGFLALIKGHDGLAAAFVAVGVGVLATLVLVSMNPFWTVQGGDCWFLIN